MILHDRGGTKRCEVVNPEKDLLMAAEHFRLYLVNEVSGDEAKPTGPGKSLILRVASEVTDNGIINNEAEVLRKMGESSDEIEQMLASKGRSPVHYDWLIPKLNVTFVCDKSQDYRQANLLEFADIEAKELFPLPKLQEYCAIDCKTAAWVLGRFFKLQCFLDYLSADDKIDPAHCLIAPGAHRLIYLGDMEKYESLGGRYPVWNDYTGVRNLRAATNSVCGWIEPGAAEADPGFMCLLKEIMIRIQMYERRRERAPHPYDEAWSDNHYDGRKAHKRLYDWIGENWGYEYHPFTYYVNSEQVWKKQSTLLQF